MNPKLSILICTRKKTQVFYVRLLEHLNTMIRASHGAVEILTDDHETDSIGTKRNRLLYGAKGNYISFIDDDDRVSDNYIDLLTEGINREVDCCSLTGIITEDGNNALVFQHSIKYQAYKTNEDVYEDTFKGRVLVYEPKVKYERYPNHLNCIKASIAKKFRFPEINHGEDTDFATQMFKAGVLKTEHWIEDVIYYYDYRSKK